MAVELTKSFQTSRGLPWQTLPRTRPNLRLVVNNQLQANASKAAFNASMERASLSQKYWEELLEKLRRAGGGGGGGNDKSFDRIAVSMMLSNFLSNKTIQAMLRNFGVEMFGLNKISNQINNANQNVFISVIQNIGKMILNHLTNALSLIVRKDAPSGRLYTALNILPVLIGILSFQFNKLKEILEEDLKEKIRKIKTAIKDFFVEMKEHVLSVIEFVANVTQGYITL